jgi:hypothetical protein
LQEEVGLAAALEACKAKVTANADTRKDTFMAEAL